MSQNDPSQMEDLAKAAAFANVLQAEQSRLPKGSAFLQRPTTNETQSERVGTSAEAVDQPQKNGGDTSSTVKRKDGSKTQNERKLSDDQSRSARVDDAKSDAKTEREQDEAKKGKERLETSRKSFATTKIEHQSEQTQSRINQILNQTVEGSPKRAMNTLPKNAKADPGKAIDPKSPVAQVVDYLEQHQKPQSARDLKKSLTAGQTQTERAQTEPKTEANSTAKGFVEAPTVAELLPTHTNTENQAPKQSVNAQVNAYEAAATQNGNAAKVDAPNFSSLSADAGLSVKKMTGEGSASFGGESNQFGGDGLSSFANLKGAKSSAMNTRLQVAQAARALLSKAAETLNSMRGTMSQRLSLSLPTQDGSSVRMVLTPQGPEGHKMIFVAASAAGADALKKLLPEIRQEIVSFPIQVDDIEITTDVIERPEDSELWASEAEPTENIHQHR